MVKTVELENIDLTPYIRREMRDVGQAQPSR